MTKSAKAPLRPKRKARSNYTPAMVQRVCDDLAAGKTYDEIGHTPGRPSYATIYNWRRQYPAFAEAVDAARAFGAEFCADRALTVAEAATEETVRKAKLHVDTLMQRAALLAPQRWSVRGAVAAPKGEPVEVIFRVKHFERVVGPDGKAFLREIKPEGEV
ncbi:hypothetical protein [Phenylobacterium sp.]|uniref:terminase small subunit-like protein n=1 Tax=Phenylobacterium sp. TaxID=1871053 RepID=UPI002EDAADDE